MRVYCITTSIIIKCRLRAGGVSAIALKPLRSRAALMRHTLPSNLSDLELLSCATHCPQTSPISSCSHGPHIALKPLRSRAALMRHTLPSNLSDLELLSCATHCPQTSPISSCSHAPHIALKPLRSRAALMRHTLPSNLSDLELLSCATHLSSSILIYDVLHKLLSTLFI